MAPPSGRVTRSRAASTQKSDITSGDEVSRNRSGRPRQPVAPSPARATQRAPIRQLLIPVGGFSPVREDDEEDDSIHEEVEAVAAEPERPAQQVLDTYLSAGGVEYDEARPWAATVLFHSFLRFLERLLNNLGLAIVSAKGLIVFLLLLSTLVTFFSIPIRTLPEGWAAQRVRMVKGGRLMVGLSEYERPPAGIEKEWIFFKHIKEFHEGDLPDYNVPDLQWTININFARRIKDLEVKTNQLANASEVVQSTISKLLPRLVVVDVIDNRLHITEELYDALRSKLDGDSTFWASFLEKNQKAIDELENTRIEQWYDTASKQQDVVSAQTALEMIQDDNERLLNSLKRDTEKARKSFIRDVRDIAEDAVIEVLEKNSGSLPPAGDLDKHHYIENTVHAMKNLNFFAPKNGAKVIPLYTSPAAIKPQKNLFARIWARAMYPPISAAAALNSWSEYQDAWCATESTNKGKAQLGVATKYRITPTELIVEHVPATGSLSIDTAPRDVELWMEVGSAEVAAYIEKLNAETPRHKGMGGCGEAPGDRFVCMAAGRYDIHSTNWVQRFPTFLDPELWPDLDSRTFVARARTNWGGDKTCLYRFRLHGRWNEQ